MLQISETNLQMSQSSRPKASTYVTSARPGLMDLCQYKSLNFTQNRLKRHSREPIQLQMTDRRQREQRDRQKTCERQRGERWEDSGERGLFFCSIYRVMAVFPARSLMSSPMTGCHIISSRLNILTVPRHGFHHLPWLRVFAPFAQLDNKRARALGV